MNTSTRWLCDVMLSEGEESRVLYSHAVVAERGLFRYTKPSQIHAKVTETLKPLAPSYKPSILQASTHVGNKIRFWSLT